MSQKEIKNSAEFIEKNLDIDTDKIGKLEDLSQEELEELASEAKVFYRNFFKPVLQELQQEQLEFLGEQVNSMEQLMFVRGTLNGLMLIEEWFQQQEGVVKDKIEKAGKGKMRDPLDNI